MKTVWVLVLAAVTAVTTYGAWRVISEQVAEDRAPGRAVRGAGAASAGLFDTLIARADEATRLEIETDRGSIVVEKTPAGWTLPSRGGYRVSDENLRRVVLNLTEMELVEPKTADPANHATLGLRRPDPSLGSGAPGEGPTRVRLMGADGALVDVIVSEPTFQAQRSRVFVRETDGDQTYLFEGRVDAPVSVRRWLPDPVIRMLEADVARVEVDRVDGAGFVLERVEGADPADAFIVADLVEGETERDTNLPTTIAGGLGYIQVEDLRPAAQLEATPVVARLRFVSSDGLVIVVTVRRASEGVAAWATFDVGVAEGVEASAELQETVDAWRANVEGFAFKLPAFASGRLLYARSALVEGEPVAGTTEPAADAGGDGASGGGDDAGAGSDG